jgi:hypothetical protein
MAAYISLTCAWCGKSFERLAKIVRAKKAKKTTCSQECRMNEKRRAQLDFWSLVDILSPGECWPWKGGIDTNGYGFFEEENRHVIAHRRAYEKHHGAIPEGDGYHGTVIRHTCDNPPCCNPGHLVPGTQADNNLDTKSRKRLKVKLTEDDVRAIRADIRPYAEICAQYGISRPTISNIKYRTTWSDVE